MNLVVANWERRDNTERTVIIEWADRELKRLAPEEAPV
jgi:hypothetical protein